MTENGGKIVILQHVLNGPLFYTLKAYTNRNYGTNKM